VKTGSRRSHRVGLTRLYAMQHTSASLNEGQSNQKRTSLEAITEQLLVSLKPLVLAGL
jgi:hypothetical protein